MKPNVAFEEIKSLTYKNGTKNTIDLLLETSLKIAKKSSWSNMLELIFSTEVQTGVPEVVEASTGFHFTAGNESSYGLGNSVEKTVLLSLKSLQVKPET